MAVGRGFGASIGVGEESTWGTEVARSNWVRVTSASIRRERAKVVIPDLGRLGQASSNHREFFVDYDYVSGGFDWLVAYDDSTILLLKHLLGANVTAGAGPYTHTLTCASPVPTGLSIEQITGTHGFNSAQQFTGCKLTSGRISCAPGSPLTASVQVIGKTSGGLEAAGTPTYSSNGERVLQHGAGTIALGGTTVPLKGFDISIDRGLERLREIGSLFTSEPVEQRLNVTIECTMAWQQADWHTKYFADTQGDFAVTFTSGAKSLAITAHNCLIEDLSEPVSSAGMVEQRATLRAFADASDQGLTLVFTNGNSSHSAN